MFAETIKRLSLHHAESNRLPLLRRLHWLSVAARGLHVSLELKTERVREAIGAVGLGGR